MRIKRIIIKKLLRKFDYNIDLNMEERITILTGPNGSGKTSILRLIKAILTLDINSIRNFNFELLELQFTNEEILIIYQMEGAVHFFNKNFGEIIFPINYSVDIDQSEKSINKYKIYKNTNTLNLPALGKQKDYNIDINIDTSSWLFNLTEQVDIYFIETQRLFKIESEQANYLIGPKVIKKLNVVEYSFDILSIIRDKLAEFASQSNSIDNNALLELLTNKEMPKITKDELVVKLENLRELSFDLQRLQLLEKDITSGITKDDIVDSRIEIANVYLMGIEEKLSILNELAIKIRLFMRLINEHFLNLDIIIDNRYGFMFEDKDKSKSMLLYPSFLSSGEQHQFVLFFELLFKVKKDSLILIDEPELSLHVAWQRKMLDNLLEISNLIGLDFILATHSPQIIDGQWELTRDLAELANEKI